MEKQAERAKGKRGDKNKQKSSKQEQRTTILLHTTTTNAGEVESNNWAVKPPQVWSLRSEPSKVTPALVLLRKREKAPAIKELFSFHYNNLKFY